MSAIPNEREFLFRQLRVGTKLQTTFGRFGKQDAEVIKVTKNGSVYVRKWQAASKKWTKPVRIHPADMVIA